MGRTCSRDLNLTDSARGACVVHRSLYVNCLAVAFDGRSTDVDITDRLWNTVNSPAGSTAYTAAHMQFKYIFQRIVHENWSISLLFNA